VARSTPRLEMHHTYALQQAFRGICGFANLPVFRDIHHIPVCCALLHLYQIASFESTNGQKSLGIIVFFEPYTG
jgi:hypothetical protein